MHRKYNKFLIVSAVAVFILGVYSYFYNDLKSEAAADASPLSSSVKTPVSSASVSGNRASSDSSFLMKLSSLKRIKIDTSIFESQGFKLLVGNTVVIESLPFGRVNPFSPIDRLPVVNKVVYTLKTSPATAITPKSAVLNGLLEGAVSDNIYFEYGLKQPLDKFTPKVISSSIGSFASNITLLNPKTTYFYRSVANVNGINIYGEIMSFSTN